MPGLDDVHTHHLLAGRADLLELNLEATSTLDQLFDVIAAQARELPADGWIVGGGWAAP
jgi:predicted amidohydrolase YtcJ